MSMDNGKQTLRFDTNNGDNVIVYERSENESTSAAGGGDYGRCHHYTWRDEDELTGTGVFLNLQNLQSTPSPHCGTYFKIIKCN